jgi:hypothetical protein
MVIGRMAGRGGVAERRGEKKQRVGVSSSDREINKREKEEKERREERATNPQDRIQVGKTREEGQMMYGSERNRH